MADDERGWAVAGANDVFLQWARWPSGGGLETGWTSCLHGALLMHQGDARRVAGRLSRPGRLHPRPRRVHPEEVAASRSRSMGALLGDG